MKYQALTLGYSTCKLLIKITSSNRNSFSSKITRRQVKILQEFKHPRWLMHEIDVHAEIPYMNYCVPYREQAMMD